MGLQTPPEQFDLATYNLLPSVEFAYQTAITDGRLNDCLYEASKLFVDFDYHQVLGLTLIHRHCELLPLEIMVEREETIERKCALVTKPEVSGVGAKACVWKLRGGKLFPLEFSTELFVVQAHEVEVSAKFLDALEALLTRFGLSDVLGLAIVERKLYNDARSGEIPVEVTRARDRANVVTLEQSNADDKLIETNWGFRKDVETSSYCSSTCRKKCHWQGEDHVDMHQAHHHVVPD